MANKTVIDELIVALKLDPADFERGTKKAAAEILKTKREVRSATDDMSKGAEKVATSFANTGGAVGKVFSRGGAVGLALALTIAAGKKVNDLLYEVAENTRKLGYDARAYNMSASGLRNMQNAAELAGGSLEDAGKSAGTLVRSLFDLKFNGAVSDGLVQLARLGVQFTDAQMRARDFKDVALDTADALEKLQQSGRMSRSEAIQFAEQAGFSGGMAQLVASGRGATQAALSRQEARRQVGAGDVGAGNDWVNAVLSRNQAAVSDVGVPSMTVDANAPGVGGVARNRGLERTIVGISNIPGRTSDAFTGAVGGASEALGDLADNARAASQSFGRAWGSQGAWFRNKYMFGPTFEKVARKYGVDESVLRGMARVESSFDPNAVSRDANGNVIARGIMQLRPKFYPTAGQNPYDDIDTAGRVMADLLSRTKGTKQERYTAALRMYHAGETNYREGTNLGPANRAYAGNVLAGTPLALPTPGMQGGVTTNHNQTDVTFEKVVINTRATNGERTAADFVEGTKRKMMAAQADAAMQ